MLFNWTEEKLEWYVRGSLYAGFHRTLAEKIRPALEKTDALVDLGCGPGLIDLELAQDVKSITAIDINQIVLQHLEEDIADRKNTNIRTVCGDVKESPDDLLPSSFDVALFSFFGGPGEVFEVAYQKASRLVIIITHGSDTAKKPSKIGGEFHRAFAGDVSAWLDENKLKYTTTYDSYDFGQPFVSLEEAERFFEVYAKEGEVGSEERLAQIDKQLSLVKKTDDPKYPYYFPNMKDTAIFLVEK